MILDDDNIILKNLEVPSRFIDEIVKELKPLLRVVYLDLKEEGITEYKFIRLVYYYYGPKFIRIDLKNDWKCKLNKSIDENVYDLTNLLVKKAIEDVCMYNKNEIKLNILRIYEINLLKVS